MTKHLIYLAAGNAQRFGQNKLLYHLEGKPLFLYGLKTLAVAAGQRPGTTLTVVSRFPQILESAKEMGLCTVDSPESTLGLSYTIRAALKTLPNLTPEDFLIFAVADQPWLSVETVLRILDAAQPGVLAGTTVWLNREGSPTLFSAALAPKLQNLTGDMGGRSILRDLGTKCIRISACSQKELYDIDVPHDLK